MRETEREREKERERECVYVCKRDPLGRHFARLKKGAPSSLNSSGDSTYANSSCLKWVGAGSLISPPRPAPWRGDAQRVVALKEAAEAQNKSSSGSSGLFVLHVAVSIYISIFILTYTCTYVYIGVYVIGIGNRE